MPTPIVIDWSKSHEDDRMDFLGWDGQMWRAMLLDGHQFHVEKVGHHEDKIINYVNYDGSNWTARHNGDKFVHAPNGDFTAAHEDTRIDYIANDNSQCSAVINGNSFTITNHSSGKTYQSSNLFYITWDRSIWTAQLSNSGFIHWQGIAQNTTENTSTIKYLTWDEGRWSATLTSEGIFKHTDENGASHLEAFIIYLNYDKSIWGARLANKKTFSHAPGFIPEDKSFWTKIIEGLHKTGISGWWPENQPQNNEHGEFRGVIVKEDKDYLYYRPVDKMGICTDNLDTYPIINILSRSRVGSCRSTGTIKDIYSFQYKKM